MTNERTNLRQLKRGACMKTALTGNQDEAIGKRVRTHENRLDQTFVANRPEQPLKRFLSECVTVDYFDQLPGAVDYSGPPDAC